ncbi:MBL fold metallo-hydrolase [Aminiphilus circumscriptus]|uniref:MBL fold metallo-hydrolase n=1 Tax=Aminiphilus circumscriptus TaxID=290732 RepID=UPI0004785D57|nr:MBL fold metallo-hydrolase [Aminiphilus circumscriptus]
MAGEPIRLGKQTWVLPGSVNIGLFEDEGKAVLLDSGGDDSAGRKLLRVVEERGLSLSLVANSHSHADHIGGNALLQKRTGCGVAASPLEGALIEQPALEPFYLWSGAPPRALQTKFLQAQPSRVTLEALPGTRLGETSLDVLDLRGHALGMVGFRTPDDVLFVADTLFSEDILGKYKVSYCADVGAALETLERLETLEAAWFVPCHAAPSEDIRGLVAANRRAFETVSALLAEAAREPAIREELFARVLERLDVALDFVQYGLLFATLSAHLTFLHEKGVLRPEFSGGRLFWERCT